ncbi:MAG: TraR/DksA family transcriptional regulator [Gammaproteobacteria bacterium]
MSNQLKDEQIHQLKEQLENRFDALWHEIGSELEGAAKERFLQIAGEVQDLEDRSVADLFADLNMTILDKHVQETRDINSALIRISKGTYDTCSDCGGSIDFDRLAAYPTASRCVRCQGTYEKSHLEGLHTNL